jgi:hypothetical protein
LLQCDLSGDRRQRVTDTAGSKKPPARIGQDGTAAGVDAKARKAVSEIVNSSRQLVSRSSAPGWTFPSPGSSKP